MSVQLVQPNLSTVGNIGWCLSFVENVFGTPHVGDTATDAWHSTQHPHTDRNLPAGVYVPVWFSYFEGGINYGHVAVHAPDGRVLSSPYAQENTHVWFSSIDQCAQVLNCTYLGWSEDLAGVQIVKETQMITKEDEMVLAQIATGSNPGDGYNYGFTGTSDWDACLNFWLGQSQLPGLRQKLADLQKEYDDLKVLKAQEKATPDVPPVPVFINDPLSPAPAPDSPSTPVDIPPSAAPKEQGSEQKPNIPSGLSTPLKVAIGAIIALLVALAAWLH